MPKMFKAEAGIRIMTDQATMDQAAAVGTERDRLRAVLANRNAMGKGSGKGKGKDCDGSQDDGGPSNAELAHLFSIGLQAAGYQVGVGPDGTGLLVGCGGGKGSGDKGKSKGKGNGRDNSDEAGDPGVHVCSDTPSIIEKDYESSMMMPQEEPQPKHIQLPVQPIQ